MYIRRLGEAYLTRAVRDYFRRRCERGEGGDAVAGQIGHGRNAIQLRHRASKRYDSRSVYVTLVNAFYRRIGSHYTVSERKYLYI